jgi:hypothetical protein
MTRFLVPAGVLGAALAISPPAPAEQIDFDDLPAANKSSQLISELDYVHLGVRFRPTDDGATWDGVSADDPGGFGLEGSRGTRFLGFDGTAYSMAVDFDDPVTGFELDVARAVGAFPYFWDMFEVTGFLDGNRVETQAVFFGAVGEWKTVTLSAEVNRVVWFGTGLLGHRYGVDALRWQDSEPSPPELLGAWVDVRPGSRHNPIRLDGKGLVPVLVYGAVDLPVEEIDPSTLAFGPGGAGVAHDHGPHFADHDGDGLLDMLVHHQVGKAAIAPDAERVCLTGETWDAQPFEGCDDVTPVGK